MGATVLVVDDEKSILQSLSGVLMDEGYKVLTAESGETALGLIKEEIPDAIMLDIWLPGIDGVETLKQIKQTIPEVPIIMISGHGSIETAVKATKLGAYDFIEKPLSLEKVILTLKNALNFSRLAEENIFLRQKISSPQEITGESEPIMQLKRQIEIVAPTEAGVLITGENGTGKELVALSIHAKSRRAHKPLVEVNCAAIPEELIESELFGHEKGSFTGAAETKRGKFDLAHGGTLLLDEIGDMSLKTQAKILRILQEKKFERVGGAKIITIDVRVIAATNKNLEEQMRKGDFREDLYYRLNVIPLHVPSLRERREDVPLLAREFLQRYTATTGDALKTITSSGMELLMAYHWPGNVRELKNIIERLVILSPRREIDVQDISRYLVKNAFEDVPLTGSDDRPLREAKAGFEREFLSRKLLLYRGNISRTAQAVGIERSHLYKKLKALGLISDKE
jgi:two-component system, NtrC family, nitrogen regulation response regulator NtrX